MSHSTDREMNAAEILNAAGRFDDARTADVNEWISKLPRKEFEYVLHLTEQDAKRSERLHAATIASQAAEIERLRGLLSRWEKYVRVDRVFNGIEFFEKLVFDTRAALQPKEGK